MINTERLCPGCMTDNGGEKICPICGFDSSEGNPMGCLPLKETVGERYIVGKAANTDGEGITYIGWDNITDTIVTIKEYFPLGFAHRNPDMTVSMLEGGEYTFNEGLLEFAEINRTIKDSELPATEEILEVFEANGTCYAVKKSISGITLEEFLEKNGGTLKWEQARALFLPLIDTVQGMNDLGIIHRGISTETVLVGRDGKMRIINYSIKKLRLSNSELEEKLYSGYAAAEQYGIEDLNDGIWTDVYGLSATIFRVLIGTVPPDASLRVQNDAMTIPARFAEELPRHVLAALANGLQVLPKDRTKDVETFKNEMVYGEVKVATVPKKGKTQADTTKKGKKKKKGKNAKYVVISALCTAVIFCGIAAALIFTVFKDDFFGNESSSLPDDGPSISVPSIDQIGTMESGAEVNAKLYDVPNFAGKYYADIVDEDEYEMFSIIITDKSFSDKYARGTIVSQSVAAGSTAVRDTEIGVVISLGPKEVKVPNLKGFTADEARLELLKLGFLYENIKVEDIYDSEEVDGVIKQEPAYGTHISTDARIVIYINTYKADEDTSSRE